MKLFFVTGSVNKVVEAKAIIPELEQLEIELEEIQEIDAHKIVAAKLSQAASFHQGALIVEDTSLTLDGMNGLPGPLIKWFLKSIGPEGIYTLSQTFGAAARANIIIGYRSEEGVVEFFESGVHGTIVEPRPTNFGWDGIFMPEGSSKTYAEITQEEKNLIGHRGKAFRKLKDYLQNN